MSKFYVSYLLCGSIIWTTNNNTIIKKLINYHPKENNPSNSQAEIHLPFP